MLEQGSRQYTNTHYIRYSTRLGTNAEPCTAPAAAAQAAALLSRPQAGSKWAGNRQINASREAVGVDAGGW